MLQTSSLDVNDESQSISVVSRDLQAVNASLQASIQYASIVGDIHTALYEPSQRDRIANGIRTSLLPPAENMSLNTLTLKGPEVKIDFNDAISCLNQVEIGQWVKLFNVKFERVNAGHKCDAPHDSLTEFSIKFTSESSILPCLPFHRDVVNLAKAYFVRSI